VGSLLLGAIAGQYQIPIGDLLSAIGRKLVGNASSPSSSIEIVLWQIRFPRLIAAGFIGAALSVSGAVYQGLFRNPLVSPDLLGVSAGAALGAILAIFFSLSIVALQGLAFLGGVVSVALVYAIGARLRGHDQTISLVLAGIAVGALLSAAISLLKVTADPYNQLPAITYWLLGSLAATNVSDLWVATPVIVLGLAPLFAIRWRINLLTLPEDEARAIGLNTRRYRLVVIAGATLATAGAVSISGIIGWVGLLVPHIARLIVGPDYQRLLPISAILGAAFLIAVDTAARSLTAVEIPIGILTAVLGTPFFVWLLASSRTGWQ